MKFIHSHFNNRLAQEQYGEAKWNKERQGFVKEWNHVVSRVTSNHAKKGQEIANTKSDKDKRRKKENAGSSKDEKEQSMTGSTHLGLGYFRNYLAIEDALNQCQVVTFQKIIGTGSRRCSIVDRHGTSKMIRLILNHLITINNSCLMKWHQFTFLFFKICQGIENNITGKKDEKKESDENRERSCAKLKITCKQED
ncbi:hypothetical protein RFI_30994 [Reticulomyxa filosa]|uniref:Uncharacterized protein n=1 Tax=Reticulomyxa filosa TaxID=46433 RepID=X6LYJ6_RETFI|nr:hypothetical protein RFI_30994 [Reticulomyxa filosa]|eukprot:ETO06401.1 hypothetical protein RFI_30994 [Reticulomyxa filosa]